MVKWITELVVCFFIAIWLYSGSVHVAVWAVGLSFVLTLLFGLWVLAREYRGKKITMPATIALFVLLVVALVVMIFSVLSVPLAGCIL